MNDLKKNKNNVLTVSVKALGPELSGHVPC